MKPDPRVIPNPVVGKRYAIGGLILLVIGMLQGGWALLLVWPASAMLLVAGGYVFWGADVYQKKNGKIGNLSAFLLAPTRLGQWLSLIYYRRKSTLYSQVQKGLYIGRQPSDQEARTLIDVGVQRVLDVTTEFSEPKVLTRLTYLNLPIPDLTAPTPKQLDQGVAFIREGLESGETVYVHCKVGYSRSAAFVGATLLSLNSTQSLEEVIELLQNIRPGIVVRPEIREALKRYLEDL